MSWDADLTDDRGHDEGQWNYTHNCNRMASVALSGSHHDPLSYPGDPAETSISWWKQLNGMTGAEGASFLDLIITKMEDDPARFRSLNPRNGWGDYDGFLKVLRDMRRASLAEYPTKWETSG